MNNQTFSKIFEHKRIMTAVILILLTAYSFCWQLGYQVFHEDQLIYLPVLLKSLDPSLFVRDIIFSQDGYTLFGQLIAGTMKILNLDLIKAIFVITFISRFIFFYAIYRLAFYFTGNRLFGVFAPVLIMAGFRVYGTNIYTIDSALLPRDIGTALGLYSLSWLLWGNVFLGGLFLLLSVLIHPAMAIPFILFYYIFIFWSQKFNWKKPTLIISILFPVMAYGWLYLNSPHLAGGLFSIFDSIWLASVLDRTAYVFLSTWKYPDASFLYLLVSVYMFFVSLKEIPKIYNDPIRKRSLFILFFVPIFVAIVALITIDGLHMVVPAQLQLGRAFVVWKIIFSLTFAYFALNHVFQKPKDSFYNFLLIGIVLSFIISEKVMFVFLPTQIFIWFRDRYSFLKKGFLRLSILPWGIVAATLGPLIYVALIHKTRGFFYESVVIVALAVPASLLWRYGRKETINLSFVPPVFMGLITLGIAAGLPFLSIQPKYAFDQPFIESCEWIKRDTDQDALFMTEPFSKEGSEALRLFCLRSVFATKKDGGQVLYGRDYALEWQKRYDLINALNDNKKILPQIVQVYGIDYIFSKSKLDIPYKLVFENGRYFIYKL